MNNKCTYCLYNFITMLASVLASVLVLKPKINRINLKIPKSFQMPYIFMMSLKKGNKLNIIFLLILICFN